MLSAMTSSVTTIFHVRTICQLLIGGDRFNSFRFATQISNVHLLRTGYSDRIWDYIKTIETRYRSVNPEERNGYTNKYFVKGTNDLLFMTKIIDTRDTFKKDHAR